jgi:hypothetical protein
MGLVSLQLPAASDIVTAGLHANNYQALLNVLNGGLTSQNISPTGGILASKVASGHSMVSSQVLGSDTASLTVTIPPNWYNARILLYTRTSLAANEESIKFVLNGDSGANYRMRSVEAISGGTWATARDTVDATRGIAGTVPANSAAAGEFGLCDLTITNYMAITGLAEIHSYGGLCTAVSQRISYYGCFYRLSGSVISSITFSPAGGAGNLKTNTRAYLYLT